MQEIKTICHVIFCLFFCQKSVYIIFCRIKKALNSNTQSLTWWRHKNQLNMLRSSLVFAAEGFYYSALFYASSTSTSPRNPFYRFLFSLEDVHKLVLWIVFHCQVSWTKKTRSHLLPPFLHSYWHSSITSYHYVVAFCVFISVY